MIELKNKREIYNESKGESKLLYFLYQTVLGRLCLKIVIKPWVSKLGGKFLNTKFSSRFIKKFVIKNNINLKDYEQREFKSYNDFFTRKIAKGKRKIENDENSLISPCDSKLSVFKINSDSKFKIKNSYYTVEDLLNGDEICKEYINGMCLIFRLSVDDYHRYCYIDNGKKEKNIYIPGEFHTVQPIAMKKYNIYKRNSREYSILHTENFGDIIQIEVGALMVGRIINYHNEYNFSKGEEKGMFEFGGSTIVLLIKENKVNIDSEIIENSKENKETIVKYGEKIGEKI